MANSNIHLMIEVTSRVLSLGLSVLKRTGNDEINQLAEESKNEKMYLLKTDEEDAIKKIIWGLCLLIKSEDESCLDVCKSNINALKLIVSSMGVVNRIPMPESIVELKKDLPTTNQLETNFCSLSLALEGIIDKIYKK